LISSCGAKKTKIKEKNSIKSQTENNRVKVYVLYEEEGGGGEENKPFIFGVLKVNFLLF